MLDRIASNGMVRYKPAKARLHIVRKLHRLAVVNDHHDGYIGKGTYFRDTNVAPTDHIYEHLNNNIHRASMYCLTCESNDTLTSDDTFASLLTRRHRNVR